jgi:hypothetical protein
MLESMTQEEYDQMRAWIDKHKHLPSFMRDYHDQKDIFKTFGNGKSPNPMDEEINWIDGHCYTVDKFPWLMAFHGYTLQKSRAKLPFQDLDKAIKERRDKEMEAIGQMIKNDKKKREAEKAE